MPKKFTKAEIAKAKQIFASLGGQSKSDARTAACRANAKLPRPNGRKPRRPREPKGKPLKKRARPVQK